MSEETWKAISRLRIRAKKQAVSGNKRILNQAATIVESQARDIAELVDCLKDMEKGDDGHAWKVARRLIEKYGAES